jgi:hypothetical protein
MGDQVARAQAINVLWGEPSAETKDMALRAENAQVEDGSGGASGPGLLCHNETCTKTENLMKCRKCKSVLYCSKEHQKAGWPVHKSFCMAAQNPDEYWIKMN